MATALSTGSTIDRASYSATVRCGIYSGTEVLRGTDCIDVD
ncbi:hypothetical protein [Vibrio parahaemolyticus]|nr:hypothetical protein [Vibrio parahaemolyticus]